MSVQIPWSLKPKSLTTREAICYGNRHTNKDLQNAFCGSGICSFEHARRLQQHWNEFGGKSENRIFECTDPSYFKLKRCKNPRSVANGRCFYMSHGNPAAGIENTPGDRIWTGRWENTANETKLHATVTNKQGTPIVIVEKDGNKFLKIYNTNKILSWDPRTNNENGPNLKGKEGSQWAVWAENSYVCPITIDEKGRITTTRLGTVHHASGWLGGHTLNFEKDLSDTSPDKTIRYMVWVWNRSNPRSTSWIRESTALSRISAAAATEAAPFWNAKTISAISVSSVVLLALLVAAVVMYARRGSRQGEMDSLAK